MSEPEFGGVWGMPGILIFEIFSLMQISQQRFIHCKRKSGLFFSSIDKWKQEAQCKIVYQVEKLPKWGNEWKKKPLDVAVRKEEMGHSQLPLHTTSPPSPSPPQKPSFVKLQKSTRQHHSCTDSIAYFVVIYLYFASRPSFMHNLHIRLSPLFSLGRFPYRFWTAKSAF